MYQYLNQMTQTPLSLILAGNYNNFYYKIYRKGLLLQQNINSSHYRPLIWKWNLYDFSIHLLGHLQ